MIPYNHCPKCGKLAVLDKETQNAGYGEEYTCPECGIWWAWGLHKALVEKYNNVSHITVSK